MYFEQLTQQERLNTCSGGVDGACLPARPLSARPAACPRLPACHLPVQDYVCEVEPTLYSSMSYTTIEISSSLAAAQQQHILGVSGWAASSGA